MTSKNPNAKHLKGGKKLGLDMEKIEFSNNHRQAIADNTEELRILRNLLSQAEKQGRYSKAKKLRRQINQLLEVELYLRHSWCGGCKLVLHLCHCQVKEA